MRAINELKPILGLELTATPQVETARRRRCRSRTSIYSYPLATAIDGRLREGAGRRDAGELRRREHTSEEQLEQLKLEDGIRVHESTKVELEVYARQNGLPIVKPFMLVVAQDTTHAERAGQS